MNTSIKLSFFFLFAGIGILGIFGFLAFQAWQMESNSVKTVAHVIDYESKRNDEGTSYSPVLEFETEDGRAISFTSKISSQIRPYGIGQELSIIYNPADPYNAVVDRFFDKYFGIIITLFLGISFIFSALYLLKLDYFNPKRREQLIAQGYSIRAPIADVMVATRRNRIPDSWRIVAKAEINNKKYTFYSESLSPHPGKMMTEYGLNEITVWYDPKNPKKYYVDVIAFSTGKG